jgi:hypothetical protein
MTTTFASHSSRPSTLTSSSTDSAIGDSRTSKDQLAVIQRYSNSDCISGNGKGSGSVLGGACCVIAPCSAPAPVTAPVAAVSIEEQNLLTLISFFPNTPKFVLNDKWAPGVTHKIEYSMLQSEMSDDRV